MDTVSAEQFLLDQISMRHRALIPTTLKTAYAEVKLRRGTVRVAGMTKGSGMIQPRMATTLGFVLTDARVTPAVLRGILTDGDLKRILLRGDADLAQAVEKVMSRAPRSIEADALIAQAVRKMEENEGGAITSLVVLDPGGRPLGVIHLHDCLDLRTR